MLMLKAEGTYLPTYLHRHVSMLHHMADVSWGLDEAWHGASRRKEYMQGKARQLIRLVLISRVEMRSSLEAW
jgi:hypothetical protein